MSYSRAQASAALTSSPRMASGDGTRSRKRDVHWLSQEIADLNIRRAKLEEDASNARIACSPE